MPPATAPLHALPTFSCSWQPRGLRAARVLAAGELDLATAPGLSETLSSAMGQATLTLIDLTELAFMDCSGLHVLLDAHTHARGSGKRLAITSGSPGIDALFTLTNTRSDLSLIDVDLAPPRLQLVGR